MGAIDVLFQQQQAKKQDWQNVGQGLSGLGQSAKEIAGTTKIQKYKKAGQMLFKLGGPTERNLQIVVKMFDLAPEETKELIITYQTFETFKNNKKLDDPASPEVLRAFGERRGVQPEEGATTRDLLGLSKLFLEQKGKEWGSQLTVPRGEEGGGEFISDKPGTKIPPGFTVPSLAGKGGEGNKEYAPDIQLRRNSDTGETIRIDERNKQEQKLAEEAGYFPIGPKAKGYLTEEGKLGAGRVKEIVESSAKARGTIATLNTMNSLLDRFESGKIADWEKSIQQWGDAFGIPIDTTNLSSKEAFQAMAEQLALQSRNMGEGMVLAGQMSDRDVQFLRDMNPQLVISKGGNRLIINIREAIAKRSLKQNELAKKYRKQNRGILDPLGFEEYVKKELSQTSIFGIPEGAALTGTDKITGLPVYESDGKYYIPSF